MELPATKSRVTGPILTKHKMTETFKQVKVRFTRELVIQLLEFGHLGFVHLKFSHSVKELTEKNNYNVK